MGNAAERTTVTQGIELSDGRKMPRIGFGTFDLAPGDETKAAVLAALEVGYRHLDCARLYANEASVGDAIREAGIARDELFVTSKVWCDRIAAGADEIRRSAEETLSALRLEAVDLLLIHWPVTVGAGYRRAWETFQELQQEGLARSIGVSNFLTEHLDALVADGDAAPVANQVQRHPYFQQRELALLCEQRGIVLEAWAPFGQGLCLNDPVIEGIAANHDADAGQIILSWLSARNTVPLPRSANPAHIALNLAGLDIALSDDELAAIDMLDCGRPCLPGDDDVSVCDRIFVGRPSPRN